MQVLMMIVLFLVLLCGTGSADECDNKCTIGEVCLETGECVDRSELVSCGFYYCVKGQECCSFGCMPEGKTCCGYFVCDTDHSCCGSFSCCSPGYYCVDGGPFCKPCDNDDCNNNNSTTKSVQTTPKLLTTKSARTTDRPFTTRYAQTTKRPFPTRYTETTQRPFTTRYVRTTPRSSVTRAYIKSSSSKSQFLWWYGLIIASAVIIAVVIFGLFLWKRRTGSNAGGAIGSGGKVLSVPAQTNQLQATSGAHVMPTSQYYVGNTTYGTKANIQPQTHQHLVVTNTSVPPYFIYNSENGNTSANVQGHTRTRQANDMHHLGAHKVERPQNLPHVHAVNRETPKRKMTNAH